VKVVTVPSAFKLNFKKEESYELYDNAKGEKPLRKLQGLSD